MDDRFVRPALGQVDWTDGTLTGDQRRESMKTLRQLAPLFHDSASIATEELERVVYRVQWIEPASACPEGGLFWGNTTLEPGRVGDEYFMTHGHYHERSSRAEFYATIRGAGFLVLMDRERKAWAEAMSPGSLHYVRAGLAHRVVNVGEEPLRFVACWPSDSGHDYGSIAEQGFSLRVVCRDGKPALISAE